MAGKLRWCESGIRMDRGRRDVIGQGGRLGLLAWLCTAGILPAWSATPVFALKGVDAVLAALGAAGAQASASISIDAAEIVEDGAMVSLEIASALPGTRQLALLAADNPTTLVALFELPPGTEARIRTRIRMAQTSSVIVVAEAGGVFHMARREIRIIQGGCG